LQVQRTKITVLYCDPEDEGRNSLHKVIPTYEATLKPNNSAANFKRNLTLHLGKISILTQQAGRKQAVKQTNKINKYFNNRRSTRLKKTPT